MDPEQIASQWIEKRFGPKWRSYRYADLMLLKEFVRDCWPKESRRPHIICLSGSSRFVETFAIKSWELERQGNLVLGIQLLPHWYCQCADHFAESTGTAEQCDELHRRKIDLADEVLVLNVGGYIGESTRKEIEYATAQGKLVKYLEPAAPERKL